jgi:hypothetical protein
LHAPQLWPLLAVSVKWTTAFETFVIAFAFNAGRTAAEPIARPVATNCRREIGAESFLPMFFISISLATSLKGLAFLQPILQHYRLYIKIIQLMTFDFCRDKKPQAPSIVA